jgi:Icc-related predicted phosphoesterase
MKVSVVSDIHGNFEDLARIAEAAEQLVVLGDLLDYIDYSDPNSGVLGAIFGSEAVARMITLRTAGNFDEFHAYDRQLWSTIDDPVTVLDAVVQEMYEQAIACLPADTLLTLGNVDLARVWRAIAPPQLQPIDGQVVTIAGVRLGFVGGGAVRALQTGSPWNSFDRDYDTYRATLAQLGEFDVLCTHLPPKIADMRFDTVAQREEMYGPGLLELIEQRQPALALSGHIHHPRAPEAEVGRTRCVNVGYFKRNPQAFVFETDDVRVG